MARRGGVWLGQVRKGQADGVWTGQDGVVCRGQVRSGGVWQKGFGGEWRGSVQQGWARQTRHGGVSQDLAW